LVKRYPLLNQAVVQVSRYRDRNAISLPSAFIFTHLLQRVEKIIAISIDYARTFPVWHYDISFYDTGISASFLQETE